MKARHKASLLTATRKLENIFRRWAGLDAGCWWFISLLWSSWVLSTAHHLFFEISTRLLPDGLPLTLGAVLMCTDLRWFHEKWIGDLEKGLIRKMGLKQSSFLILYQDRSINVVSWMFLSQFCSYSYFNQYNPSEIRSLNKLNTTKHFSISHFDRSSGNTYCEMKFSF